MTSNVSTMSKDHQAWGNTTIFLRNQHWWIKYCVNAGFTACLYLELCRLLLLWGLTARDLLQLLLQRRQALLQFFLRVGSGEVASEIGWHSLHSEVNAFVLNHLFASYPSHQLLSQFPPLPVTVMLTSYSSLFLPPACLYHPPYSPIFFPI